MWVVVRDGMWRFIFGFWILVYVCDLVENNVDFDFKFFRINLFKDWNWILFGLIKFKI